jgi:Putative prokaryotic signal transducing protein
MKKVFAAKTPTEAHLVRSLLEREGIAAEVQGEWLTGAMGEVPLTPDTWPSVWILNDTQLEKANAFVSDYERRTKKTG